MEYEIKPVGRFQFRLSELWKYRELFYFFTWRDIKIKYRQAVLGIAWSVLQPVLMVAIFSLVFGNGFRLNDTGMQLPYPVFVFSGLLFWNVFSNGVTNASNSMVANSNMIKKIYFPRLIIPISSILVAVFDLLMVLGVFVACMIYFGVSLHLAQLCWFITSLLLTVFTTLGLGAWMAALNVKYRDVKYIVPFLVQLLLFVTPVIYPTSIVPYEWVRTLLSYNPVGGAIDLFRASLTGADPTLQSFLHPLLISLIIFAYGVSYFKKTEFYFADIA